MSDFPLPEPDILRRLLLLLLTIILVARPLVWGEDTGLVSDFSDASGLALVLMAIIAAAAWGGWRLVNKQSAIYLGPVDYALLALSLLLAVGVGGLGYRRAGMLAGWEWFALGLLLVLVRQLAVRPEDKQGILCVLLATAVSLSAQGTYQAIRDIPVAVNEARVSREVLAPALLAGSLVGSRSDNVLTSITLAGFAASPAVRGYAGEPDLKTWIRSDVARR